MAEDNEKEMRAPARLARASWKLFLRGARRHAMSARDWARAEGLEELMRAREERSREVRTAREARARARRPKRSQRPPRAPERPMTDLELKSRALGLRTLRSIAVVSAPCALIVYPPVALMSGDPGWMSAWPIAYIYLTWDGWLHRSDDRDDERMSGDALDHERKVKLPAKRLKASGLKPSAMESEIIRRIASWEEHASERKLQDIITDHPVIDESGLIVPIGFRGQWTPAKLGMQIDQVRALLAVPDDVRTQINPGGTADRALLRIRTRVRELDLTWTPERRGIGLDADTGEVVDVDDTDRVLVAGMSGAGKSVALRVLFAKALRRKHTVLGIIDLKVEGALWSHTARVESEPDGIEHFVAELVEEMRERESIMRAQSLDKWVPTEERPRIVVAIDEGAELISEVEDCITGLRSIARRARSAEIVLYWATQKPTVTGSGRGLDSAISMQLTTQIALAVPSPVETRNVLGEDATLKGWHAEDLQKGGWALVRVQGEDRTPNPVRVWYMTKEHVKALPARKAWRREIATQNREQSVLDVALQLSEGYNGVSTARLSNALGVTDAEVHSRMRTYGIAPEPNAFAIGTGEKARGYRRTVLENAKNRTKGNT